MIASSARVFVLFLVLTGCSAARPGQSELTACIDLVGESLNVTLRNGTSTDLIVASESPQVGCCAINELSLFIAGRDDAELRHCSYLDHFSPMKTQVLRSGDALTYSLSVVSVQAHYCNVDIENHRLVAVFLARRGEDAHDVLRASSPIRYCAQ